MKKPEYNWVDAIVLVWATALAFLALTALFPGWGPLWVWMQKDSASGWAQAISSTAAIIVALRLATRPERKEKGVAKYLLKQSVKEAWWFGEYLSWSNPDSITRLAGQLERHFEDALAAIAKVRVEHLEQAEIDELIQLRQMMVNLQHWSKLIGPTDTTSDAFNRLRFEARRMRQHVAKMNGLDMQYRYSDEI